MAVTLTICDESAAGDIIHRIPVSFQSELTSVKEIIRARVYAEALAYNEKLPEYYRGLVQPANAEATLNGYRLKERRRIDPEQQCYIAWSAFTNNGYFVLIDNMQAESLDQMVVVNEHTKISFVKLTPLVGG